MKSLNKINLKKTLLAVICLVLFVGVSVIIGIIAFYALTFVVSIGSTIYALPLVVLIVSSCLIFILKR